MRDIQRVKNNQVMSAAIIFNHVAYLLGQVTQNDAQGVDGQTR